MRLRCWAGNFRLLAFVMVSIAGGNAEHFLMLGKFINQMPFVRPKRPANDTPKDGVNTARTNANDQAPEDKPNA